MSMTTIKSTVVKSVDIRCHTSKVWKDIGGLYMKESNTLAGNATIKQLQRGILRNTKGQYMKESNTLEDNVTIKQLQKEI